MADTLIINCEAIAIRNLLEEAAAWEAIGNLRNAEACRAAAANALAASDVEDPHAEAVTTRPLTAAELEQRAADEQEAAVQQEAADLIDGNDQLLRDRVDQALENLGAAHANWATLTAPQKDAALRLNVRVTLALARLQLRKLDETD